MLVNGLLTFVDLSLPRQDVLVFVLIVPLESLWLLVLGVLMWRRSGRTGAASAAAVAVPPQALSVGR